jgi:lipopolysaccharide export system protein LptA
MKLLTMTLCLMIVFGTYFASPGSAQDNATPSPPAASATPKDQNRNPDRPISITADEMVADDRERMVVFSGSVVTRQEDMVLTCDLMKVYYRSSVMAQAGDPDRAASDADQSGIDGMGSEIETIEAEGNVKITRGDKVAQAQKAVYQAKARPRTIVLTGEPRIWRDKDFLTGKRIVYYLDEDRSVVESGDKQRVNAIFYQVPTDKGGPSSSATGGSNSDADNRPGTAR